MKTAAIYARVSTADQVRGTSLDTQVDECRAFAEQSGYTVLKEIREDMSGALLARPGLDALRAMAEGREIQALIVAEQDRLSRDFAHTLFLVQDFERQQVELLFVREPKEETPEGKMLFQMKGMFKEYERTKIAERSRRGKDRRAREGRVLGTSFVPYGYSYAVGEGRYQVLDAEAQWVESMFQWFVSEGGTLRSITRKLNELGVPTKRGAAYWCPPTIRAILKNKTYTGVWSFNKSQAVPASRPGRQKRAVSPSKRQMAGKSGQVWRPEEEWISVQVPRIIPAELYEAAQGRLERNKKKSLRNCKNEYLLRGMLVCADCGRLFTGRSSHPRRIRSTGTTGTYVQYFCSGKYDPGKKAACRAPWLTAPTIEDRVWDALVKQMTGKRLKAALEQSDPALRAERDREEAQMIGHIARENCIKAEEDRLLDAFSKGVIELDQLRERMVLTKKERDGIQAAKRELEERMKQRERAVASREAVEAWCRVTKHGLRLLGYDDKAALLEALDFRGVVDGGAGKLYISWRLTNTALDLGEKATQAGGYPVDCVNSVSAPSSF
jgi:site-specific DNA recombinase